jgi:hypothetical protein
MYTIDMNSLLILSASFIPRPGTSPIPLVSESPAAWGWQSLATLLPTWPGSLPYPGHRGLTQDTLIHDLEPSLPAASPCLPVQLPLVYRPATSATLLAEPPCEFLVLFLRLCPPLSFLLLFLPPLLPTLSPPPSLLLEPRAWCMGGTLLPSPTPHPREPACWLHVGTDRPRPFLKFCFLLSPAAPTGSVPKRYIVSQGRVWGSGKASGARCQDWTSASSLSSEGGQGSPVGGCHP